MEQATYSINWAAVGVIVTLTGILLGFLAGYLTLFFDKKIAQHEKVMKDYIKMECAPREATQEHFNAVDRRLDRLER